MLLTFYKIINIILSPFIVPIILYRLYKGKEDKSRIGERFGVASYARPQGKLLWIHAASIGETISMLPLINFCDKNIDYRILFTTGTVTSARIAKSNIPGKVTHQYVPLENYFIIRRFLTHWQPNLAIFAESEFWPCLVDETASRCTLLSLNTRVSDSTYKSWKFFNSFCKAVLRNFATFIPQSLEDKNKIEKLGFSNVKFIGNLKYSVPSLPYDPGDLIALQDKVKGRTIILFASIHPGEERVAAEIYEQIKGFKKSVLMIIVPRHPVCSSDMHDLLQQRGYQSTLWSQTESITDKEEFCIVDAVGKLGLFFRVSPITIMGGTFVTGIGGHNIIEPARLKSVVITGPHTYNFKEICQDFKTAEAAIFVNDASSCAKAIKVLWESKSSYNKYIKNADKLIASKATVLENTIDYIKDFL